MAWMTGEPLVLEREARPLGLTILALAAAILFEHFVVHRTMILPTMQLWHDVPPWMWAALFIPELVTAFVAGWRLRGWRTIAVYATAAGVLREGIEYALERLGEPGHFHQLVSHASRALDGSAVVAVYFLVFGLAAHSAHELGPGRDALLDRDGEPR